MLPSLKATNVWRWLRYISHPSEGTLTCGSRIRYTEIANLHTGNTMIRELILIYDVWLKDNQGWWWSDNDVVLPSNLLFTCKFDTLYIGISKLNVIGPSSLRNKVSTCWLVKWDGSGWERVIRQWRVISVLPCVKRKGDGYCNGNGVMHWKHQQEWKLLTWEYRERDKHIHA